MTVSVVILAGGKGERFWPKSREAMPKQFVALNNKGTMLQLTYDRAKLLTNSNNIYVATGIKYSELVKKQLPELPEENVLVEPEGRNTAPCIGVAAVILEHLDSENIMVVLPADHYIANLENFVLAMQRAISVAVSKRALITIGVVPTRPETGYGYIEMGTRGSIDGIQFHEVQSFKEKPDYQTSIEYVSSGNFLWNSGMFVWPARSLLEEMKRYQPLLFSGLIKLSDAFKEGTFQEILPDIYKTLPKESIDYALLEKVQGLLVVEGSFGWDDVGNWASLPRVFNVDEEGNYLQGSVVALGTHGCILDGKTKLIAAVGVENLVVVDTDDVILICPKDQAHDVKFLLEELRKKKMENYL